MDAIHMWPQPLQPPSGCEPLSSAHEGSHTLSLMDRKTSPQAASFRTHSMKDLDKDNFASHCLKLTCSSSGQISLHPKPDTEQRG